jgi:hypothetical protein
MPGLNKITTTYSETEDRLRLVGEDAAGEAVVLWLTRRLVNRLVRQLVEWLEAEDGGALAALGPELRQSWAQEKAVRQLEPSAPVRARGDAPKLLVASVDLSRDQRRYVLRFRTADDTAPSLSLSSTELRQWLGIVHQLYLAADWPRDPWPAWMEETAPTEQRQPALLH